MEKEEIKNFTKVGIKVCNVFNTSKGAKVMLGNLTEPTIEEIKSRHGDEVELSNGKKVGMKSLHQIVYLVPIKQRIAKSKYKMGGAVFDAEKDENGYFIPMDEDRPIMSQDTKHIKKAIVLYANKKINSIFAFIDEENSNKLKGFEINKNDLYSISEFTQAQRFN